MSRQIEELEEKIIRPLTHASGNAYRITVFLLSGIFLWGLLAWAHQYRNGLAVTGLGVPIFWGFYIINFVFFIGISHAGTLISSILRITKASWRRPFTRVAETITIASLPFAATCVIVDLGRPDRFLNVILYAHLSSPILWDVICISSYIALSCLYFFAALVPDIALCRDRLQGMGYFRRYLYKYLSLGWKNTKAEMRFHDRLMTILSLLLLMLVISVHTNVGFIFGMTTKPGWHTAAIGPYFVIGAAFQGLGALSATIILVRKIFHMEWIITDEQLNALKKFFLAMACFWAYFTFIEFLTTYYGQHQAEMHVFWEKFSGRYSPGFWTMLMFCIGIPIPLLLFGRNHLPRVLLLAGISVNLGMWMERYNIIVPSGALTILPWKSIQYSGSWVEWSITIAWVAGFVLLFLILARLFPIFTIWELREGLQEQESREASRR